MSSSFAAGSSSATSASSVAAASGAGGGGGGGGTVPAGYSVAPGLLFANFNQDFGCFAVGTTAGFRIYNTDPLQEKVRREFLDVPGGIAIAEMLHRTNYIALVGGGRHPKFPTNRVMIWDDLKGRIVMEFQMRSEVKAVRFRKDRLVIVLLNKVVVYTFSPKPLRLYSFDTMPNDRGLIALAPAPPLVDGAPISATLVFLGRARGQIQYCDLPVAISMIAAHTSDMAAFTVSHSGHLIATASETGTLIRVFEARSGRLVSELRRGLDKAEIFCIAFNLEGTRICVSSDKGTVHIFNVGTPADGTISDTPSRGSVGPTSSLSSSSNLPNPQSGADQEVKGNRQSSLSFFSPISKYFSSQWSFAQFSLPTEARCICAFAIADRAGGGSEGARRGIMAAAAADAAARDAAAAATSNRSSTSAPFSFVFNSAASPNHGHLEHPLPQTRWSPPPPLQASAVVVLCADGTLHKFAFDPRKGGEAVRESFYRFYRGLQEESDATVDGGVDWSRRW
ncbi:WD40-repeat-containing domain protein [Zopfochytrium polystomum]|nr:WD40-repeat-containing domain protein [Zopfochytrium polystomum]